MQDTGLTIRLPSGLAEPLRREAARQGTEVETLVGRLVARYLRRAEPDKLSSEIEAFRTMHDDLLARYRGRYVAVHDGRVVDHDANRRALYLRIRARFGETPVLIRQVTDQAEREWVVLSPRLERGI